MDTSDTTRTAVKTINKVSYALAKPKVVDSKNVFAGDNNTQIIRQVSADMVIIEQPLKINLAWQEHGETNDKQSIMPRRSHRYSKNDVFGFPVLLPR